MDLEKDNENMAKEQAQQAEIRATSGTDQGGSIAEERALRPGKHNSHNCSNQPPGQPPGGGPTRLRINSKGGQGRPPSNAPAQTAASSSGPPPPPSNGPKVMAASSATQKPKPEQFDLTIDDDRHDAHDGTSKVLAEQEQAVLERKIAVAEIVAHHLGPSSTTADQACMARLTALGRAGRP